MWKPCIADEMYKSKPDTGLDLVNGSEFANSCPREVFGQIFTLQFSSLYVNFGVIFFPF